MIVSTLEELRALIGRPVAALRLASGVVAYVAEDAAGLPFNPVSTWLANELGCGLGLDDFLHGPAVVFSCLNKDGDWDGLEYDCPPAIREMLERKEDESVAIHAQGLLFDC